MRLVLASNNAKKLAELKALFAPLPLEIVVIVAHIFFLPPF